MHFKQRLNWSEIRTFVLWSHLPRLQSPPRCPPPPQYRCLLLPWKTGISSFVTQTTRLYSRQIATLYILPLSAPASLQTLTNIAPAMADGQQSQASRAWTRRSSGKSKRKACWNFAPWRCTRSTLRIRPRWHRLEGGWEHPVRAFEPWQRGSTPQWSCPADFSVLISRAYDAHKSSHLESLACGRDALLLICNRVRSVI